MNYTIIYRFADGSERVDHAEKFATAFYIANCFYPEGAVYSKIVDSNGKHWGFRLKGV